MGFKRKTIHFIGVSGIGVSAVAYLSIKRGYTVTGSALERNGLVDNLEKIGMKFYLGHRAENINNPDLVVRSAAVKDDNPEVEEANKKDIDVIFYSKYLGMLMSEKIGIAVAGTHGKTTTTAMLATILKHSGLKPEVVCGGIMKEFNSNAIYGDGKYFLAEACEYNRSFLDLKKSYGIVTNIEADHLDYYGSFENVLNSFSDFINGSNKSSVFIVNGDDKAILNVTDKSKIQIVRVGYGYENDIVIENIEETKGRFKYTLKIKDEHTRKYFSKSSLEDFSIKLSIPGKFNIINSALASALALRLGINPEYIKNTIKNFVGTERRLEKIGIYKGNPVISDYAHHPTEIINTIDAVKAEYPDRHILLIYQPHQYSRTSFFFDQFVESLVKPDYLILTSIYKQRDSKEYLERIKSIDLYDSVKKIKEKAVFFIENPQNIWKFIQEFVKSDNMVIIFMGAGDIDKYARMFPE